MKNSSVFGIAFVAFAMLTGTVVKGNGPEKLFQILLFGAIGGGITTELYSIGKTVNRMTRREELNNNTEINYARSQAIAAQDRLRVNGTGNRTTVTQTEDYTPDIWEIPQIDVVDNPSSEPEYPTYYGDNNWDDQTSTVTPEVQIPEPVYQAPVETPQQDSTPAPTYEAPSYTPDTTPYTSDPGPSYTDYGSSYTDTSNY
jgi:hypothetical protein